MYNNYWMFDLIEELANNDVTKNRKIQDAYDEWRESEVDDYWD